MTAYTCVARPCKHHPRTEIPEGEERWVRPPLTKLKAARHPDCVEAPLVPVHSTSRPLPSHLMPEPGGLIPSVEEAPHTEPEKDIVPGSVYGVRVSRDGGVTWTETVHVTGTHVLKAIAPARTDGAVKGNDRRVFTIRPGDYHPLLTEFHRWIDTDGLPKVLHSRAGSIFRYGERPYLAAYDRINHVWKVRNNMPDAKLVVSGQSTLAEAIAATIASLSGQPCGGGSIILQDSCPGCDTDNEEWKSTPGVRIAD